MSEQLQLPNRYSWENHIGHDLTAFVSVKEYHDCHIVRDADTGELELIVGKERDHDTNGITARCHDCDMIIGLPHDDIVWNT